MENRGGVRPGAGAKPRVSLSDSEVKKLVRAAKKKAKETGKNVAAMLVELMYQTDDKRTGLTAIKLYYDKVIIPHSTSEVETTKVTKPAIGLPPKKKDPALKLVKTGTDDK